MYFWNGSYRWVLFLSLETDLYAFAWLYISSIKSIKCKYSLPGTCTVATPHSKDKLRIPIAQEETGFYPMIKAEKNNKWLHQ